MKKIFLTLSLALFLSGCSDNWQATVYPNKNNLKVYKNLGTFSSLEECRSACLEYLEEIHASNRGDYECGKNCKYDSGYDMYICEETLK